jgi:glucokinase
VSAPDGTGLIGAVDLGGTKADLAVATADGRIVRRTRVPTLAAQGAADVLARVLRALQDLAEGGLLESVALAVPASVHDGRVSAGTNIPGLTGFDVAGAVHQVMPGARVHVMNDLNAAANAVRAEGPARGCRLIFGLGTGIAAAVLVDGRVVLGSHGEAGEIGMTRVHASQGLDRAPRGLLGASRLEEFVGGRALDDLAVEHGMTAARELLDAADSAPVRDAVVPRLQALAFAVATCVNLVDPDHVLFYGGLSRHPLVRNALGAAIPPSGAGPRTVVWSDDAAPPVLVGAVGVAASRLP